MAHIYSISLRRIQFRRVYSVLWYRIHLPSQETQETWVGSLCQEDPVEKEMAMSSSLLAWKIPWTQEPNRL